MNDFQKIEDNINQVRDLVNKINQEIQEVTQIIESCEKDIKESSNSLTSINNILLQPDNINNNLFKCSSNKMKQSIFRELNFNYRRYQKIINQSNKQKAKAYELQYKYMKLLRGIFPDPLLECKVCFEFKKEILTGANCGHLICESCYAQILKNNIPPDQPKCPSCMVYFAVKPIKLYL